jgi:hypothetical protein
MPVYAWQRIALRELWVLWVVHGTTLEVMIRTSPPGVPDCHFRPGAAYASDQHHFVPQSISFGRKKPFRKPG